MLVEGPQAVREVVRHRGQWLRDVYVSDEAADRHPDILTAAHLATRWVHLVSDEVAHAMSPDAQGVLAVASQEAVVGGPDRGEPGTVAVLARAQDPGNVGAIIRTADAMGASRVVVTEGTVDVHSPKVVRASAGSVFHLPIVSEGSLVDVAAAFHDEELLIMGTSGTSGSIGLDAVLGEALTRAEGALTVPHAWVFGNEAQGLSDEEEGACDILVRIPMSGDAESLNVASAAAMCLFASQQARSPQVSAASD